jgi:anaerobic selenocysteine-containing dehydrogenase
VDSGQPLLGDAQVLRRVEQWLFEIRETETTAFADYVLPDTMTYEREEIVNYGHVLVDCPPCVEPGYEIRNEADIYPELAQRLGLGQYFERTRDENYELWLTCDDPAVTTVEPPITLERLREEQMIKLNTPQRCYDIFSDGGQLTESGRYNFYREELVGIKAGPVVDRIPALIDDQDMRAKYPLHLFIGRSRFFMQGQLREIAELDALSGSGPRLGMTVEDAQARGLKQGDMVEVFNGKGVVKVPLVIVNFLQPGMVHLWYAYGVKWYEPYGSEPAQELGSNCGMYEGADELNATWTPYLVDLYGKLGVPAALCNSCGISGAETIWDILCDVRRAE